MLLTPDIPSCSILSFFPLRLLENCAEREGQAAQAKGRWGKEKENVRELPGWMPWLNFNMKMFNKYLLNESSKVQRPSSRQMRVMLWDVYGSFSASALLTFWAK